MVKRSRSRSRGRDGQLRGNRQRIRCFTRHLGKFDYDACKKILEEQRETAPHDQEALAAFLRAVVRHVNKIQKRRGQADEREPLGLVARLLRDGADVNYPSAYPDQSPFHKACFQKNFAVLDTMLSAFEAGTALFEEPGFQDFERCPNPSHLWRHGVSSGDNELLSILLRAQCAREWTWQNYVASVGESRAQKESFQRNTDHENIRDFALRPQYSGFPLHEVIALHADDKQAASLLKEFLDARVGHGSKAFTVFDVNAVDAYEGTPLHATAKRNFVACAKALLAHKPTRPNGSKWCEAKLDASDVPAAGGTPLAGHVQAAGATPLMLAAEAGHTEMVQLLLARIRLSDVANVHTCDDRDRTALHYFCMGDNDAEEIARLLTNAKVSVNATDTLGDAALHLAARNGLSRVVEHLHSRHADPKLPNGLMRTALHEAAFAGHDAVVRTILDTTGTRLVLLPDMNNWSALALAFQRETIVQHLVSRLASALGREEVELDVVLSGKLLGFAQLHHRDFPKFLESVGSENLLRLLDDTTDLTIARELEVLEDAWAEHQGDYAWFRRRFEQLFADGSSCARVIALLLEAGAEIPLDDGFAKIGQLSHYERNKNKLAAAATEDQAVAFSNPVFEEKLMHAAVDTLWSQLGLKARAYFMLASWALFVLLLTVWALRYSGHNSYESFALSLTIQDRLSTGEDGDLQGVASLDAWHAYIESVFVDAMWASSTQSFVDAAGNHRLVNSSAPLLGGALALLGRPRYRQLRTRADSCAASMPSAFRQTDDFCFASFTQAANAQPGDAVEDRTPIPCAGASVDWQDSRAVPLYGRFGFYGGGGYSAILPANVTLAREMLADLRTCDFLSLNTRFAALEFTLYSRTQGLVSHGSIFVEQTTTGGVFAGQRWSTFKLFPSDNNPGLEVIVFIMYAVLQASRVSKGMFRSVVDVCKPRSSEAHKISPLAKARRAERVAKTADLKQTYNPAREAALKQTYNPSGHGGRDEIGADTPLWKRFGLCAERTSTASSSVLRWGGEAALGCLFVALASVHFALSSEVRASLAAWHELSVSDEFVDVSSIVWLASVRQYLLATTVFLCYLKTLEYLQGTPHFAMPVMVIWGMLRKLASFFVIFAVFIMAFAIFAYVLYGFHYGPASSVMRAILLAFKSSLGDLDVDGMHELDHTVGTVMVVLAGFVLVILLLNLLVAVMSEAYEDVKSSAEKRWCYSQFMSIQQTVDANKGKKRTRMQRRIPSPRGAESGSFQGPTAERHADFDLGYSDDATGRSRRREGWQGESKSSYPADDQDDATSLFKAVRRESWQNDAESKGSEYPNLTNASSPAQPHRGRRISSSSREYFHHDSDEEY